MAIQSRNVRVSREQDTFPLDTQTHSGCLCVRAKACHKEVSPAPALPHGSALQTTPAVQTAAKTRFAALCCHALRSVAVLAQRCRQGPRRQADLSACARPRLRQRRRRTRPHTLPQAEQPSVPQATGVDGADRGFVICRVVQVAMLDWTQPLKGAQASAAAHPYVSQWKSSNSMYLWPRLETGILRVACGNLLPGPLMHTPDAPAPATEPAPP